MNYLRDHRDKPYKWPYPVDYDKENRIDVDVLVIGGGLAGCSVGIAAARRGASVAVIDKAPMERSGCGGCGIDHYNSIFENPNSPWTTEEIIEKTMEGGVHSLGHRDYIAMKGTWDALLELEKMGLPVRDEDGEFAGAIFRDEYSGYMKSYNYRDMISIKLRGGHFVKPLLYRTMKKEKNVQAYNRIMMTKLLTEGGQRGARVIGAMGFSMETGELYVFHAKSAVMATGYITGPWLFNTEISGASYQNDPNEIGEGFTMAWDAGADIYGMDQNGSEGGGGPYTWPNYGQGNCTNTWFPCNVVDENEKPIPWADVNGKILKTLAERNLPAEGQHHMGVSSSDKMLGIDTPDLVNDLGARIKAGEFQLPLWADLSSMPSDERRSIWGMMVGNEGKTRFPVFDYYTRWGFNPDKHELMGQMASPAPFNKTHGWFTGEAGESDRISAWRRATRSNGNIATDWDQMSTLPGLFAAGSACGVEGCSFALSSGFYTGDRAYEYSLSVENCPLDEEQIRIEKERIYAPVRRSNNPGAYVSWKELNTGISRVMMDFCGRYLTIPSLEIGLKWLKSIEEYELQLTFARNPHELARALECETRMVCSKAYIQCALSCLQDSLGKIQKYSVNRYSGDILGNSDEGAQYIFHRFNGSGVELVKKYGDYWLGGENLPTYLGNYNLHRAKEAL